MRYGYLIKYPQVFLKMTGLRTNEFDKLVTDVLPQWQAMEKQRLYREQRQREAGGGRASELSGRDQVLLTVVWLRVYATHEVLG